MASGGRLDSRPLAGRVGEMDEVVRLVRTAAQGCSGALLVSGEAGVGKTSLVREACAQAGDIADVLWASCLPMTSLAVPFLPLATALRDWTGERGETLPQLGRQDTSGGSLLMAFDGWLADVCRRRPIVLVVDDVQWADQSSLDVLMYVLAGPMDRRLAVIVTLRTADELNAGALAGWLADVRRLPRVDGLSLRRLDRSATADQLALLLGRQPHHSLVDDVFLRTRGNPYLTSLLARGLSPDARHLPDDLPTELNGAVARTWRGLSPSAKRLTRLLAVAGRPSTAAELSPVVALSVGIADNLQAPLREAVSAGVLDVDVNGDYWFTHPLLGEVLEADLPPEDRRAQHAMFARSLQPGPRGSSGEADASRAIAVANHYFLAGELENAYQWALSGADAAEHVGGSVECLRLLRRALDLSSRVGTSEGSRLDLLLQIRTTAERAGQNEEELAAIEDLLTVVDRNGRPLLASDLLVRRMDLRLTTGQEFAGLDDVREAVRLSAVEPTSAEHAFAMAELANAELWHDEPSGPATAREAVRLARASGSRKALSYALTAQAKSRVMHGEPGGFALAQEAQGAAAQARDFWAFTHATFWGGNAVDCTASRWYVEHLESARKQLVSMGAPHPYVARLATAEAEGRLLLGDWRACAERLHESLGSNPGPMGGTGARLTAALLACWQGRRHEAEQHLARAEEFVADPSAFLMWEFDAVRAEIAVANHDTDGAVAAALRGVGGGLEKPTLVERLIPLAARALADEVQTARDRAESTRGPEKRLRELREDFPDVIADSGGAARPTRPRYAPCRPGTTRRSCVAWSSQEVQLPGIEPRRPVPGAGWRGTRPTPGTDLLRRCSPSARRGSRPQCPCGRRTSSPLTWRPHRSSPRWRRSRRARGFHSAVRAKALRSKPSPNLLPLRPGNERSWPTSWPGAPTARSRATWSSVRRR